MSVTSPLIDRWIRRGIGWTWGFQPQVIPFQIAPNSRIQVPGTRRDFEGDEGVLVFMDAIFDSSHGGISIESYPNNLIGMWNSINNDIVDGLQNQTNIITWGTVAPQTPPGIYGIHTMKELAWEQWCRLFLINADPVNAITCYGYVFIMAYLTEKKPPTMENIHKLAIMAQLFPEHTQEVREILKPHMKRLMERR